MKGIRQSRQRAKTTSPFTRPGGPRLQRLPGSQDNVVQALDFDEKSDGGDDPSSPADRQYATKAQLESLDAAYDKLDKYVEHTIEQLKSRVTAQVSQLKEWVESRVKSSEDRIRLVTPEAGADRRRLVTPEPSHPSSAQGGKNGIDELTARIASCEERFESIIAETQTRIAALERFEKNGDVTPRVADGVRRRRVSIDSEVKELAEHDASELQEVIDTQIAKSRANSHATSPEKPKSRANSHISSSHAHEAVEHMEVVVQEDSFIRVVARVRPKLSKEKKSADGLEVHPNRSSLKLVNNRGESKSFIVDHVFDSRGADGQKVVFQQFGKDYVNFSLNGYNVCMFAYGHTGSGKTHTMLGHRGTDATGNAAGIIPRFLQEVFDTHEQDGLLRQYTCEFYEVYNEQIKDLLVDGKSGDRVRKVHVHPKHGVTVENLTMNVVATAEEALRLVEFGNQMRAVATTTMNSRSSRSHAIFTFKYEQNSEEKSCQSTVTFVDLAGREDQAASENKQMQFREMCCINTSLFHLANVITKLTKGVIDVNAVHDGSLADFRNSKLTLLLSPALVGNSKSALIATVAPLQKFYDDSVSTLNFAASVKKIKTRTVVNTKSREGVLSELEEEVLRLKEELSVSQDGELETEKALLAAQAMIEKYKHSWEEAVAKSEEYENRRNKTLKNMGLPDLNKLGTTLRTESNTPVPFLTKLSNDPSLQGRCNYMLDKDTLCIGSDEKCDLVLHGLGILPRMCEIHSKDNKIEIVLRNDDAESAPRVLVEGYPLLPSHGARALSHGACIFLGYSHAFRLVVPTPANLGKSGFADPGVIARETVEKLDMESAVAEIVDESGEQFKEVLPYVNNLSSHATDSTVQAFISSIRRICPLIDEANMITREIFGNDGVAFQLHALTNVFDFAHDYPELVVCVLQNQAMKAKFKRGVKTIMHKLKKAKSEDNLAPSPVSADTSELLGTAQHPLAHAMGLSDHMTIDKNPLVYVWSLEKFLSRLNMIRDMYNDGCEAKDNFRCVRRQVSANPNMNPWQEAPVGESAMPSMSPHHGHGQLKKCNSMRWAAEQIHLRLQDPTTVDINERITALEERVANDVPSDVAPKVLDELYERLKTLEESSANKTEDAAPKATEHLMGLEAKLSREAQVRLQALEEQIQCNVQLEQKLERVSGHVVECKSALELAVDDLAGKMSEQAAMKDMQGKITDARCVSLQKALSGLQGQLETLRIERSGLKSEKSGFFEFFERRLSEKFVALETKVTEISKNECQVSLSDFRCKQERFASNLDKVLREVAQIQTFEQTLGKVTSSITDIEHKLGSGFTSREEFADLRTCVDNLVASEKHAKEIEGEAQAVSTQSALITTQIEQRLASFASAQDLFDLRVHVDGGFKALLVRFEASKYVSERQDICADQTFRYFMGSLDERITKINTECHKNNHLIDRLLEKNGLKLKVKKVKSADVTKHLESLHEKSEVHRKKKFATETCQKKHKEFKTSMISICFDVWARGWEADCLRGYRKAHPKMFQKSKSQVGFNIIDLTEKPAILLQSSPEITEDQSQLPELSEIVSIASESSDTPMSPDPKRKASDPRFLTVPSPGRVKVLSRSKSAGSVGSLPPLVEES